MERGDFTAVGPAADAEPDQPADDADLVVQVVIAEVTAMDVTTLHEQLGSRSLAKTGTLDTRRRRLAEAMLAERGHPVVADDESTDGEGGAA